MNNSFEDMPYVSWVHFKDGHKEEIIFYRYLSYNPVRVSILTPKSIYLYEEEPLPEVFKDIGKVILPRITNCRFYEYDKSNVEDFPMCDRDIKAKYRYRDDFDKITLYVPDMCK